MVRDLIGYRDSSAMVRIHLSKGKHSNLHFITVSGFKSQAQKDQDSKDEYSVDKFFKDLQNNYQTTHKDTILQDLKLEVDQKVDPEALDIELPKNEKN